MTDGQHISSRTVDRQVAICLTANSGLWVRRLGFLCLVHLFLALLSKLIYVSASLSLCKMVEGSVYVIEYSVVPSIVQSQND